MSPHISPFLYLCLTCFLILNLPLPASVTRPLPSYLYLCLCLLSVYLCLSLSVRLSIPCVFSGLFDRHYLFRRLPISLSVTLCFPILICNLRLPIYYVSFCLLRGSFRYFCWRVYL